jgi:hypothetical protein
MTVKKFGIAPRFRKLRRRLKRDCSGLAIIEFAFAAPIVLGLGMLGTETAYFVITHMQMSQIAMQVADNASRVGEMDVLVARRVYERDVNEVFVGAEKYGERYRVFKHGRIILSSLQQNATGGQTIRWQRCRGAKVHQSSYGVQGVGATGTGFPGMGEAGQEIQASPGTAVMFVEVSYTFQALTPFKIFEGREVNYTAAFNIRDNRDLSQLHQSNPPAPVSSCNQYTAT